MDPEKREGLSGTGNPASGILRDEWDRRAADQGTSASGVLFQRFPPSLNEYLHQRHLSLVAGKLLPLVPAGARLLDIGCGYGRIGSDIRLRRPDLQLIGVDFSLTYCRLFTNDTSAPVICADLSTLPFRESVADALLCVTSLMYVPTAHRQKVFSAMIGNLKPGGLALLIDPGQEFLNLFRLFRSRKPVYTTGGTGFTLEEYNRLGCTGPSDILDAGGFMTFSLLLPVLYALHNHSGMLRPILRFVEAADLPLYRMRKLTLHRWMLIRKRKYS